MAETVITDEKDRIFEAILLTDTVDENGVHIPINENTFQALDQISKKGGVVHDYHTNTVVGTLLQYDRTPIEHPDLPGTMAIKGRIMIFQNAGESCDLAWNKVRSGEYGGISFGGRIDSSGNLEGHEFALCEKSANPPNKIRAVSVAQAGKSANWILQTGIDIKQPFADFKDFADCVRKNQNVDNPEAYCASVKKKVEETPKYSAAERRAEQGGLMTGNRTPPANGSVKQQESVKDVLPEEAPGKVEKGKLESETTKEEKRGGAQDAQKPPTQQAPPEDEKKKEEDEKKREEAGEVPAPAGPAPAAPDAGQDMLASINEKLDRLLTALMPPQQASKEGAVSQGMTEEKIGKIVNQALDARLSTGGSAPKPPTDNTAPPIDVKKILSGEDNRSFRELGKLAQRGGS